MKLMELEIQTWGYSDESIILVLADKIIDPSIKTIISTENIFQSEMSILICSAPELVALSSKMC